MIVYTILLIDLQAPKDSEVVGVTTDPAAAIDLILDDNEDLRDDIETGNFSTHHSSQETIYHFHEHYLEYRVAQHEVK